jgi:plastocyanin
MMTHYFITLITIVILHGEAVVQTASRDQHHVVAIQTFRFQPSHLVITPGDIVEWVNGDIVPHTITADGGIWESHTLKEGEIWRVKVDHPGIYSYFCAFHPHMAGVLEAR